MSRIALAMIGLVGIVGCDGGTDEFPAAEVRLQALQSCGGVEQMLRETAVNQMNQRLDDALKGALDGVGRCYAMEDMYRGDPVAMAAPTAGAANMQSGGSSRATQVSGTNNQVAGVAEADFIKNDDKYIYVLTDKSFRIIEAWPPETAKEIANVPLTATAKKLFVHNDRALVYSSVPRSTKNGEMARSAPGYYYNQSECTYGYSCSFTGDGNATEIAVFDISDRTAPKLVREIRLSGSYINARRVGSSVFTVVSSPGVRFPELRYYPESLPYCSDQAVDKLTIILAFEQLRAENQKIIEETPIDNWLPSIVDDVKTGDDAGKRADLVTGCDGFYRSGLADGDQFTTLLTVSIDNERPADFATIISRPGAVYASADALYLAVPHEHQQRHRWFTEMGEYKQVSTIHKFALDAENAVARYAASGVIKGRALNQFAMDEHEGFFRVATSTGHVPSPDVHSTMTVLQQRGENLKKVGIVDNLAPKEDIRSVRFDGDRAFVVTFKKTDPLFVFDLSNPKDPEVLAELKIPGFSTYMQMMDANHLMSIGYDADDQGSFAWFTGVMLQIFDVSDPENPVRTHKEVIGTRGSSSEALTNHLAFTYFAPKNLLALPMTVCEGGSGGGGYGQEMTFSGLMVFDATVDGGFARKGRVPHPTGAEIGCHNWWTNASSQVKRSIVMDDYVFSISKSLIKANQLDNLTKDVASLPLEDE